MNEAAAEIYSWYIFRCGLDSILKIGIQLQYFLFM